MSKIYLISENTLKKHSLINNNVDGGYITSVIDIVQNIDLDTLIGPVLKDKLCEQVADNSISLPENVHYKDLLDNYITEYMIWQVMSQIQLAVNYKITNSGVIENQDERKTRSDYSTSRALQSQYANYAAAYATKMKNFIERNLTWFPEYHKCKNFETSEDVEPGGIYFPSGCCRRSYIGK